MKRISEEELTAIRTNAYQDEDRYKYAGNCTVTAAQRQLEADKKSAKADEEHAYETGKQVGLNAGRKVMRELIDDIRSRTTNKDYIFYCAGEHIISLNSYLKTMADALEKKYLEE